MASIHFDGVGKVFSEGTVALEEFDTQRAGTLVGASGIILTLLAGVALW